MRKVLVLVVVVVVVCPREGFARPQETRPGCWYEGRRYQESQPVNTSEPCLRCRCRDGSLRCRLRVCPRLPSPVPSGCSTIYPRDNACCAELVCGDSHERNVTARRDPAKNVRSQDNGCLHEGLRYAPGSAIMGSRRCEYCYCISGSRRCLRPRCLLPLAGCTPLYAPYSCCPVAYNCTNSAHHSVPSSEASSSSGNGCRVGSHWYHEGEMVRDISHKAECDNCFCAMGRVRCVPLACAPPLQGCTPIVRQGHCCPSTYNCSGSIEVKATQNYASYAFISKDYAKFRKETNFFPMEEEKEDDYYYQSIGNWTFEGRSQKNPRPESSEEPLVITEKSEANSTTETMDNEIPTETMDYGKSSTVQQETTFETIPTEDYRTSTLLDTTTGEIEVETVTEELRTGSRSTEAILDPEFGVKVNWQEEEDFSTTGPADTEGQEGTSGTPLVRERNILKGEEGESDLENSGRVKTALLAKIENSSERASSGQLKNASGTVKLGNLSERAASGMAEFENSSERGEKDVSQSYSVAEEAEIPVKGPATGSPSSILMPDNIFVMNVTLRTNVSVGLVRSSSTGNPVRSMAPDVQAILNMTNRRKAQDYEEYEQFERPTLPPSLPNVRIIPFVAADALVKNDEEAPVTNYPIVSPEPQQLGAPGDANGPGFYDVATQENRFSPPVETEGGFVPREPPYFEPLYHSTDLDLEVHTGVTVLPPDLTNPHRKNGELGTNCRFENRDFHHGDILPSSGHCIICVCYYGEVACSDEKCPPLKIGCRRIETEKICCGKIICVDSDESPTVVLDRADPVAASPRQPLPPIDGVVSPDPFRDVIRTEPAPDLPSLIEDMLPYLAKGTTSLPTTTSTLESNVHGHYQLEPDEDFPPESPIGDAYAPKLNSSPTAASLEEPEGGTHSMEISIELTTSQPEPVVHPSIDRMDEEPLPEKPDEHSSFSLGNVFDILFSGDSPKETPQRHPENVKVKGSSTSDAEKMEDSSRFPENKEKMKEVSIPSPEKMEDSLQLPENRVKVKGSSIFNPEKMDNPLQLSENREKVKDSDAEKMEDSPQLPENRVKVKGSSMLNPEKMEIPLQFSENREKDSISNAEKMEDSAQLPEVKVKGSSTSDSSDLEKREDSSRLPEKREDPTSPRSEERTKNWVKVEEVTARSTVVNIPSSSSPSTDNEIGSSVNGLLKLAGCNIYGRMYRVGRIITELSSPCLECRCTEVGVQCKQLEC